MTLQALGFHLYLDIHVRVHPSRGFSSMSVLRIIEFRAGRKPWGHFAEGSITSFGHSTCEFLLYRRNHGHGCLCRIQMAASIQGLFLSRLMLSAFPRVPGVLCLPHKLQDHFSHYALSTWRWNSISSNLHKYSSDSRCAPFVGQLQWIHAVPLEPD